VTAVVQGDALVEVSPLADLVQGLDDHPGRAVEFRGATLELVDLIQDDDGQDHLVIPEGEERFGAMQQDAGIQDVGFLDAGQGLDLFRGPARPRFSGYRERLRNRRRFSSTGPASSSRPGEKPERAGG